MFSFRYISDVYRQKWMILLQIIIFSAVTIYRYCDMLFSYGDKASIKNVYQFLKNAVFKGYWQKFLRQDNVHTNTESVQCTSIVYSICLYKYNQWAVQTGRKKSKSVILNCTAAVFLSSFAIIIIKQ